MKSTRILACLIVLACIAACKKNDDNSNVVPVYTTYTNMEDVMQLLSVKPKQVTINGTTGGTFSGTSGTVYMFPANCFIDGTGADVTTNVVITVAEYLKKGDMMFSKMLPVCGTEPLISGGQISVSAVAQGDGRKVYLKPGVMFTARVPQGGTALTGMQFFSGVPADDTSVNKVAWQKQDSVGGGGFVFNHSMQDDTLDILSDSLRMCNADQFMTSPNYQDFKVKISVSGTATISSSDVVRAYAVYDTVKGVWPLGWGAAPVNNEYSEHHVPDIKVHFVVYALINKHFYGGTTAAKPQTGQTYTVTLFEVKPEDFKAQLNGL